MTPFKPKKVEKEWGYELWLANDEEEDYCCKILFIKKGHSTSMHYHINKHETFHVFRGKLRVDMLRDRNAQEHPFTMSCEEGECMKMERERAHKLIADGEDLTLIEMSTCHKDSDSHRLWK